MNQANSQTSVYIFINVLDLNLKSESLLFRWWYIFRNFAFSLGVIRDIYIAFPIQSLPTDPKIQNFMNLESFEESPVPDGYHHWMKLATQLNFKKVVYTTIMSFPDRFQKCLSKLRDSSKKIEVLLVSQFIPTLVDLPFVVNRSFSTMHLKYLLPSIETLAIHNFPVPDRLSFIDLSQFPLPLFLPQTELVLSTDDSVSPSEMAEKKPRYIPKTPAQHIPQDDQDQPNTTSTLSLPPQKYTSLVAKYPRTIHQFGLFKHFQVTIFKPKHSRPTYSTDFKPNSLNNVTSQDLQPIILSLANKPFTLEPSIPRLQRLWNHLLLLLWDYFCSHRNQYPKVDFIGSRLSQIRPNDFTPGVIVQLVEWGQKNGCSTRIVGTGKYQTIRFVFSDLEQSS